MSKVYAFIFARGGSKGLKRKNALKLGGIPLLAHSILQAKQVRTIEKIFVSTDDSELRDIAIQYGAEVIDRPSELSGDNSPEIEAWRHAITYLRSKGELFDIFLSLPATSPLRSVEDIESCIVALDDVTDSVITVTSASRNPYFNMVVKNEDGNCEIMNKSMGYSRRQDAPIAYDITTVAYVLRPDHIMAQKGVLEGKVKPIEIPKERAVDIDDIWDFKLAELIYESKSRS
jgi:N,N'-diacetyl-8-epilegionaminate cytidylyltransferase